MKKILFFAVILAFSQAKAQTVSPPHGMMPSQLGAVTVDTSWKKNLIEPKKDSLIKSRLSPFNRNLEAGNRTTERIIVLPNTDKMPVAQTDRGGYNMPIAGKKTNGIYYMPRPKADSVRKRTP